MRRRALLASIGSLSAGCLAAPETGDTAGSTTSPGGNEPPVTTSTPPCESTTEPPSAESPDESGTAGEYRLTDLTTSTRTDRPSARYVLEPSAFYSADAVEREADRTGERQVVMDVSAVDDEAARDAIETAIRTGDWRSDTLPDGLAETVGRVDFFTGVASGSATHVGLTLYRLHPDRPPALEFGAAIVDEVVSTGSPGVVELRLANRSGTTQQVFSGTVPPFGTVFAESVDADEEFLLWRDYEAEGCVSFTDTGLATCAIGVVTELGPCEHLARRYRVLPAGTTHHPEYTAPPGPGRYRITDSLSYYEQDGAPESALSFAVEFSLEPVA